MAFYKISYISLLVLVYLVCSSLYSEKTRILVFSKTTDFRHASIKDGITMFFKLAKENGFIVDTTENEKAFTVENLKRYKAVVFLSVTGNVFNDAQRDAFERYIRAGGGFMGIHGASAAEYNWPWYGNLVGARFESHPPKLQRAVIHIQGNQHPATKGLPFSWEPVEEWYNFKSISPLITVLATVSESTYEGGKHGDNHPIIWCQEFDRGKSFYSALGHLPEAYRDTIFVRHILSGLNWVTGLSELPNSSKMKTADLISKGLSKVLLAGKESVQEPMELAITSSGKVFLIERRGNIRLYNPENGTTKVITTIPVLSEYENGLLGIALDPDFENNHWMYLFYSAPSGELIYHLSRFNYNPDKERIEPGSEKILLKIPADIIEGNHTGGSLAFDKHGNLFVSVGDNTIPFESKGYAPIDERENRAVFDAQRSSGNSNDLRGKILRIHPEPDGTYSVPEGNLFPKDGSIGRPEIYVMGNRNPFRITVDTANSWLYWGEVGPDAANDGPHGPRGYDEINQARKAGNYGWPYFVADNKPYAKVDFATDSIGGLFNVDTPINKAVLNTGSTQLPPAQKAFIWYPYASSEHFPLTGAGSRTAMAGPVYHYNENLKSANKLPAYYDGALFIYDWMRNWIMAVRMDKQGNYISMEPFMPHSTFAAIIDMEIGPDGCLYMLEYGFTWFQPNPDARLSKIVYSAQIEKASSQIKKASSQIISNTTKVAQTKTAGPPAANSTKKIHPGLQLMNLSDCKSCHTLNEKSVGPSYKAIATKYYNTPGEVSRLAKKIISGGGGVWGPHAMSAHPQLSQKQAEEIVSYILSLKKK